MPVNGGRKTVNEFFDNVGTVRHFEEIVFFFLSKSVVIPLDFFGFIVEDFERDQVEVSIEDLAVCLVAFLYLDRIATIDSHNFDKISRSDPIYMRVIGYHLHRSRSLSFRHVLQQLLELNILLVSKSAQVMD